MDSQLKADWIKALRSGDYKQCDGKLYDKETDGFCCLGVLGSICGAEFGAYENDEGGVYDEEAVLKGELISETESQEFKKSFAEKLGIPDQHALMSLNDGFKLDKPEDPLFVRKHTFPEIADYIEANIPAEVAATPAQSSKGE